MSETRYTCNSCQRYFVASETATRVKCPECGVVNILRAAASSGIVVGAFGSNHNPSMQALPEYTLQEASRIAKNLLYEDVSGGWFSLDTKEGVDSCYSKCYALSKDKNEVFVTKAFCTINGVSMHDIFNVYWEPKFELVWNATTVSNLQVLESDLGQQLIHAQYKTTSATVSRNDAVYRRAHAIDSDSIWAYAVSEKTQRKPEQGGWRRGYVVFSGFLVESLGAQKNKVSLIHCWDFNGLIHAKFIEEEQRRVALRLSKLKKMVLENVARPQVRQPPPVHHTSNAPAQVYSSGVPGGSGTSRMCPNCKVTASSNFCGNCGSQTSAICAKCLAPAGDTKYCGMCGNKLA